MKCKYFGRTPTKMNEGMSKYAWFQNPSEMTEKQRGWNFLFPDMVEKCSKKQHGSLIDINKFEHITQKLGELPSQEKDEMGQISSPCVKNLTYVTRKLGTKSDNL